MDIMAPLNKMLHYRKLHIGEQLSSHDDYNVFELLNIDNSSYPGGLIVHHSPIGKGMAIHLIKTTEFAHCIVVCDSITRQAQTEFEQASTTARRFEILHPNDFAFEKPKNKLVPRYEVLTERETVEQEDGLKCPRTKWAKMMLDDPMARYLGLSVGQVVHNIDNDILRVIVDTVE